MNQSSLDRRALEGGVLCLEVEDILRILPHRPPMLLVDRVVSLIPELHAVGWRAITGNEYGLLTRRHGFRFPATIAFDALVQLASIIVCFDEARMRAIDLKKSEVPPVCVGLETIHGVSVQRELLRATRLDLTASVVARAGEMFTVDAHAVLGDEAYVDARFDLRRREREDG